MSNEVSKGNEVLQNLQSLKNILNDISNKLNHQVLANIETMINEHPEINQNISVLIRSPLKQITGRLNGLHRVLDQIKNQIVSNGNSK